MNIKPRYKGLKVTMTMEQAVIPVEYMVSEHDYKWMETCVCGLVHTWKQKSGREDSVTNCRWRIVKLWDSDINDEYEKIVYVCKCGEEIFPRRVPRLVEKNMPGIQRITGEMTWTPTGKRGKKPLRPDFVAPQFNLEDYFDGIKGKAIWMEPSGIQYEPGWSGSFMVNGT